MEAWTWKILRRYASTIHKEYIQRLAAAMEEPKGGIFYDLLDLLNAHCILEEGGNTGLQLVVDKRVQKYVDSLVEFSKMEPGASLYEELAYRLGGPLGMRQVGDIYFGFPVNEGRFKKRRG